MVKIFAELTDNVKVGMAINQIESTAVYNVSRSELDKVDSEAAFNLACGAPKQTFKAVKIAEIFQTKFSAANETFHTATWTFQVLSNLYSIFHFLNSSTVFVISFVTVQAFGLGIKPFGHKILAAGANSLIHSGVVNKTSNSKLQSLILFKRSADP